MSESRTQSFTDDGRRTEVVAKEVEEGGEKHTITEVYVEPKIEKKLQKVVIESQKPFVYKKTTELFDESTGEVVERLEEDLDPGSRLQVVERLVSSTSTSSKQAAQNVVNSLAVGNDCNVTRDELLEIVQLLIESNRNNNKSDAGAVAVDEKKMSPDATWTTSPPVKIDTSLYQKTAGVDNDSSSLAHYVLWGIIAACVLVLVYMVMSGR